MKNKLLKAAVAGLILTVSNYSNAALVRTTIDLTITSISGNYAAVAVNDIFNYQADYDDTGTYMQITDTTNECLSSHMPTAGITCTNIHSPSAFQFFSNSLNNFAQLFDVTAMLHDNNQFYERTTLDMSRSWRRFTTAGSNDIHQLINDKFSSSINTDVPEQNANLFYRNLANETQQTHIRFIISNINTHPLTVPEPSTLAIFALGMMGLGFRRFKK